MSNGTSMDYKNGMKGNWRRTIHNRFVELLPVKPSEAVVLYLAGIQDLDRAEFLRRGFKSHNLICVEKHGHTANEIRASGKLCIKAELGEVIAACRKFPVHVVLGDFCCGLELSIPKIIDQMIENPCFDSSVVLFNVMRGRDPRSRQFRAIFGAGDTKHRGKMIERYYLSRITKLLSDLSQSHPTQDLFDHFLLSSLEKILERNFENSLVGNYLSPSGQYFDSVVFRNTTPWGAADTSINHAIRSGVEANIKMDIAGWVKRETDRYGIDNLLNPRKVYWHGRYMEGAVDKIAAETMEGIKDSLEKSMSRWVEEAIAKQTMDLDNPVSRQFAAIKAHRTMRINGTFPG